MTDNPLPNSAAQTGRNAIGGPVGSPMDAKVGNTVDFGFRRVDRAEKSGLVRAVFDSVAPRYDVMNDLMSLGVHRIWKRIFVSDLGPRPGLQLLDLAGGTGDITFGWLNAGGGPVLLTDINTAMLRVGRDRAIETGWTAQVSSHCGLVTPSFFANPKS